MKKLLLLLLSMLFISNLHGQVYELTCAAGSSPIYPVGVTFNQSTGQYRQWLCVDTNGNVNIAGGGGTITGGGTSPHLALWTGPTAIGNSSFSDDGSGTFSRTGALIVKATSGNLTLQTATSGDIVLTTVVGRINMTSGVASTSNWTFSNGSLNIAALNGNVAVAAQNFTLGTAGATNTPLIFQGSTSGSAQLGVAAVAGLPNPLQLPISTGSNGQLLSTDGGNPQQLSWVSTALPAHLTYSDPTLTVSAATFGNGSVALSGNTSGVASCTAPAVAGTATNPVTCSNSFQLPSGTVYGWNGDTGLSRDSAGVIDVGNGTAGNQGGTMVATLFSAPFFGSKSGGNNVMDFSSSAGLLGFANTSFIGWTSGGISTSAKDTGISRLSAGVIAIGTGARGSVAGTIDSGSILINGGTSPTAGFISEGDTTVGSLPAAAAGNKGQHISVHDSTTITIEGQTCSGGGAVEALAFSDGSVWKCF